MKPSRKSPLARRALELAAHNASRLQEAEAHVTLAGDQNAAAQKQLQHAADVYESLGNRDQEEIVRRQMAESTRHAK